MLLSGIRSKQQRDEAPLAVDLDTFLLAWANRYYAYAVIRLAEEL